MKRVVEENRLADFAVARELKGEIFDDLRGGKSLLLLGPRRMGKTTLLRQIKRELGSEFQPLFLDCRIASTLEDLYRALNEAALRESASAAATQDFSTLAELCAKLLDLVSAYRNLRANGLDKASLVKHLYAFMEYAETLGELDGLVEGPLAEVLRLDTATPHGEAGIQLLQQLLRQLAQHPEEDLPHTLLAQHPLSKRLLPWLRLRSGGLSEVEVQALFSAFHAGTPSPLLLLDEAQAISSPEFRPFFAALSAAQSFNFVLCADGLAGELLRLVQTIGPAKRHPFLQPSEKQGITLRYVGPLTQVELTQLVQNQLSQTECSTDTEALERIRKRTAGIPHYAQQLTRLCVEEAKAVASEQITPQRVEAAFERLLQEKDPDFAFLFEGLPLLQRTSLMQIASSKNRTKTANEQALEALAERFLIARISAGVWQVTDEVFCAWLRRLGVLDE